MGSAGPALPPHRPGQFTGSANSGCRWGPGQTPRKQAPSRTHRVQPGSSRHRPPPFPWQLLAQSWGHRKVRLEEEAAGQEPARSRGLLCKGPLCARGSACLPLAGCAQGRGPESPACRAVDRKKTHTAHPPNTKLSFILVVRRQKNVQLQESFSKQRLNMS